MGSFSEILNLRSGSTKLLHPTAIIRSPKLFLLGSAVPGRAWVFCPGDDLLAHLLTCPSGHPHASVHSPFAPIRYGGDFLSSREPGGLREAFIPVWQCRIGNSVHCQVKRCSQRKDKWLKENVGLVFKTATAWVPSSCRLTFPRPHGMLVNTSTARLSSTFSPWTVISMRCTVKTQGFLKSYNHKNHCY